MALIRRVVFLAALAFAVGAIYAQNAITGISLKSEIENIERMLARPDSTGIRRHDALVRLARLRRLSGDIEGAAGNWYEAATVPGAANEETLLSYAYCLAAMGDWERASIVLAPLLHKSPRARFLEISMNAWKTGDVSALGVIANNSEYAHMRPEIYYMLWKSSGGAAAETWRRRLRAEFPQSPEGRLAGAGDASSVTAKPAPFWLFLGARDSLLQLEAAAFSPLPVAASFKPSAPPPASRPRPSSPEAETAPQAVRLQTGVFSREANARKQFEDLRTAGFSPSIERRVSGGSEVWAVTVLAGRDVSAGIRELREKGFESFPLR